LALRLAVVEPRPCGTRDAQSGHLEPRLSHKAIFRRLDQGPKGRVERPSLHNRQPIVVRRSLDCAALWAASLGTTDMNTHESGLARPSLRLVPVRRNVL